MVPHINCSTAKPAATSQYGTDKRNLIFANNGISVAYGIAPESRENKVGKIQWCCDHWIFYIKQLAGRRILHLRFLLQGVSGAFPTSVVIDTLSVILHSRILLRAAQDF